MPVVVDGALAAVSHVPSSARVARWCASAAEMLALYRSARFVIGVVGMRAREQVASMRLIGLVKRPLLSSSLSGRCTRGVESTYPPCGLHGATLAPGPVVQLAETPFSARKTLWALLDNRFVESSMQHGCKGEHI